MISKNTIRIGLALCIGFAALVAVGPAEAKKKVTLTITGEIKPAEKRNGKVVTVYIVDAEHGEFFVMRGTTVGKEVVKRVGQTIVATGFVGDAIREKEFERYIDILEYEEVLAVTAVN